MCGEGQRVKLNALIEFGKWVNLMAMFEAHSVAVIGWQKSFYSLLWSNYMSQIVGQNWLECERSQYRVSGVNVCCLLMPRIDESAFKLGTSTMRSFCTTT